MKCPKCGHRKAKNKPCKFCHRVYVANYCRTPIGLIRKRYSAMLVRVKSKDWPTPDFSKEWFIDWAFNDEDFKRLFVEWEKTKFNKWESPSLDRINAEETYLKKNIRWISWSDNWEKGNLETQRVAPGSNQEFGQIEDLSDIPF